MSHERYEGFIQKHQEKQANTPGKDKAVPKIKPAQSQRGLEIATA